MHDIYPENQEQIDEQGWHVQHDPELEDLIDRADQHFTIDTPQIRTVTARMRPQEGDLTVIGTHLYGSNPPLIGLLNCIVDERGNIPTNTPPERNNAYAAAFTDPLDPERLVGYTEVTNKMLLLGSGQQEQQVPYLIISSNPKAPVRMGMMNPAASIRTETVLPG